MKFLLNSALTLTYNQLSAFSGLGNFWQIFDIAFGTQYNRSGAEILRLHWLSGDFSQLPQIEILDNTILGNANGAYAGSTNKIYLSANFVETATPKAISVVLLEEIGHFIDSHVNLSDSAGDEGAIFAELVQGNILGTTTLQALKAEDDHATITVNGENIQVEQQNFTGTNGNNSITGTSGNDTISPLRGQDTVNGGTGTDLLIVNYSSNSSGIESAISSNGTGGFNGYFYAYEDSVDFSNIERFQITGTELNDTIYTGNGNDTINSGGGDDTINGGEGNDNINGGEGIDTLIDDLSSSTSNLTFDTTGNTIVTPTGLNYSNIEAFSITTGSGNDTIKLKESYSDSINTGSGNDTINTGLGQDTVNGGTGTDLLIVNYSSNSSGIESAISSNGTGGFNGYFYAYEDSVDFSNIERFQITGTELNDTIYTGNGNDTINSGGGDDTINGGEGNDNINGGEGIDTLIDDLSSSTSNLTFDTTGNTIVTPTGLNYSNIEAFSITTGSGNDTIKLKESYSDSINTGSGNDTINTGLGQDTVNGGTGTDLLIVNYSSNSSGIESAISSNGTGGFNGYFYAYEDSVDFSNIEQFQITGTELNDTIYTGNGNDTINGGGGDDTINGGEGNDNINGGEGIDTLIDDLSSSTSNLTFDTTGNTIVTPTGLNYSNIEAFSITTGSGNDTIKLKESYSDSINTGSGNDTINTGLGQDTVNGGTGTDLLIVNYSSNYSSGIESAISSNGTGGFNGYFYAYEDSVDFSNIEQFQITGTELNDTIYTGNGNDTINGGGGDDTINGGEGNDNINGGEGIDTLIDDLSSSTSNLTFDTTGNTIVTPTGLNYSNIEAFSITTGSGNDTIKLKESYSDSINTGSGNDTINTGLGQDTVNGGTGTDLLIVNYSSNYSSGIESAISSNGTGGFNGYFYAYEDSVDFSNIEQFQITGTELNDTIYTGNGNDTINGGGGDDTIDGGEGNDTINGVNGTLLTAGLGEIDTLTGGTGSDRFILGNTTKAYYDDGNALTNGSNDYADITDFNTGDIIQLQGTSSNYLLAVVGADTQILINKPNTEPDELIGIVRNQTGLSLTGTYFSYVSNITLPTITLAVSPSSVQENGATNLTYTFTRSVVTPNAVTVNYTIGDTATFNNDYTQTGATTFTGTTGTITFAAGDTATTKQITIDPTADTTVESDETVALTLLAGTGYTVGTPAAVTGTILNDDTSIALAVSPSSVLEDGPASLVYTFTRTGVTNTAITVNFGVAGTADSSDYTQAGATTFTATGGTINFAAGETTKTLTIDPTVDTTVENDETVALTILAGTGYTVGTPAAVTGTILNDDTSIALAVSPSSVLEDGPASLVYTFTRTGVTNTAITVNFGVAGTADSSDYTQAGATTFTATGGTINFAAGETTKTLTIDPTVDTTVENDETVALTILAGTGYTVGTPAAVTGTITNDDTSIALAVSPSSVLEDGPASLVYTFTRTGVTNTAITVNFGVAGTADSSDYTQAGATTFTATGGTINFAAGETTKTLTIDPTVDTTVENDETVALTILAGTGYTVGTPAAVTGTITNDDTSIALAVSPSSVLEDDTTNLVYTFTRTGVTNTAITVNYGIGGTATFNNDYTQTGATTFTATGGTITFAAGETTKQIIIDPTADTIVENDETVALTLATGTGYNIHTPGSVTGTIMTTTPTITLALLPSSVLEDGLTNLVYTFTRSVVTTTAVTVNYTIGGTATFNNDYTQTGAATFTGTTGTITFAAGSSTATLTIDPTLDTTVESNETVALTLATGTGYTVGTASAVTGTITNDDTIITLAVSPGSVLEDGATNLVYTFTRSVVTPNAVTVNYTIGGTATFNNDYTQTGAATFTGTTGTITFAAGSSTATLTIDPTVDTTVESNETVALTLAAGTGYTVGTTAAVTGTITNDDTRIALTVSPSSVLEDGTPNLVYTFTRTGVTTNAITVNFGVAGTADSSDYIQTGAATFTGTTGTITFAAGETTKTLTIDPTADTTDTIDETVDLTLLAGTGYNNIATPTAVTGTITNDDTSIALAVSPSSVLEDGTTNLVYTFTRTGVTTNAITVNYGVTGTATFNNDYTQTGATTFTGTGGTITFLANSAIATLTIDPTVDTTGESDETVALTLATGTGYTVGTNTAVTGTITNDDFPTITLAVSPSSVQENGTPNLVYTFTRTGVTTNALTVNYTIGGTADSADYTGATPGTGKTITFAAGNSTATLIIDPTADTTVESNETVALTLAAGTGVYTVGTNTAVTGTITNDDTMIALAVSSSSVLENGTPNLVYTFTRTGVTNTAVTVNFGVTGTATFSNDYTQTGATSFTATGGTINFATGETTKQITIDPTADTIVENDETVVLTLATGTGYNNIATPTAVTGTITNDDTSIALAVSSSSVQEDGTPNLVYTFTRTGVTNTAITVNFGVTGTATFNNDYTQTGATSLTATGGTINFAAGETTKQITIDPTADTIAENDETVALTLLAGTGYNNIATPAAVTGTILNDEFPIIDLSSDQTILESDTNPQNVTYTVTLSTSSNQTITVNYATADGTATAGLDYISTNGTLTFAPGITTQTINIPILDDNLNEADEAFTLTLTSPNNVNLGTKTSATTTITDTLTSSVTTTLPAGVENLILTGTAAIDGTGNDGNNILTGNSADNTLTASAGNDTLNGGDGVDTVDYSQLETSITLQAQGTVNKGALGTDTVQAEKFIGNPDSVFDNVINAGSNSINADLSTNSLTVFGLPAGDVTFTVENFQDVTGSQGNDTIKGNNDTITGNNLNGSGGDDTLIASAGNDTLTGGDGVDTVDYRQLATSITLQAQGTVDKGTFGTDTVEKAEVFIGNSAFANVINAGSNSINADLSTNSLTVFGLPAGDVTFTVENFQNVTGSQGNDTIKGNNDTITGNNLNGSGGDDTLIASVGNDTLTGGDGVDTVDYRQLATSITFQGQGTVNKDDLGTDTVEAEVIIGNDDFTNAIDAASNTDNSINADLSANSLTVFGLPAGDVTFTVVNFLDVTGSQVNDIITGNDLDNTLNGGAGDDILIASQGNDALIGGDGVDIVDYGQLATKITLQAQGTVNKGALGTDTVEAEVFIGNSDFANAINAGSNSINADLSTNSLTVFGLPAGDVTFTVVNFQDVTGSQVNDIITGNDLDNTLNGGAGADVLSGGTGDDSYYVDNAGDIVKENANEGNDTVFTTISYTLASNLENLTLLGTSAIKATGNGLNNSLTGNNAANTIDGGIGNDTLNGGRGNDILLGGVGADDLTGGIGNDLIYLGANDNAVDTVRYTAGHGTDTIYQFVRGVNGDKIDFSGITNIDVVTSGINTRFAVGDGISGNTGFGTGQLLGTLSSTNGFTSDSVNVNLFGGNFLFS